MKQRKIFKCAHCGLEIRFGDPAAKLFMEEIFCSERCALLYADINSYPWDRKAEFEYIKDKGNGYGICFFCEEFFTNGRYAIFDKLDMSKVQTDDDELFYFWFPPQSFLVRELKDLKNLFDNTTLKHGFASEISCSIIRDDGSVEFIDDYKDLNFILEYTENERGQIEYAFVDKFLIFVSNGKKVVMTTWSKK